MVQPKTKSGSNDRSSTQSVLNEWSNATLIGRDPAEGAETLTLFGAKPYNLPSLDKPKPKARYDYAWQKMEQLDFL